MAQQIQQQPKDEHQSNWDAFNICLSAAVPLWIVSMKDWDWERKNFLIKSYEAEDIWCKMDVLFNGMGKKGEVAHVFNAIAKSIAVLAHCPGGITCFGLHFDAAEVLGYFSGMHQQTVPVDVAKFHQTFAAFHAQLIKGG